MSCPSCGTPAVPGARFCFACGTALPGDTDLEAERRVVTVLFGDLSDFTSWSEELDPERVGSVTDRVLSTLTAAVDEFGGHVDKLTGDGLMAVFGAPVAHEDDPERAVRAAARMQQAVRRVVEEESGGGRRLGLRVGLNTGEVLAGMQAHVSYTVIGDTVNTAARLSDVAGVGAVLAGRGTALATMSTASWRALQPLRLKGKREPVTAYELVSLRAQGASRLGIGDEAPLLDRDAELGLLIGRLLEVSESGTTRVALISGEAGIGKTRLAQELTRFAGELPGARILWGRCAPYGEGRDLAAVSEMVRTACGIGEGDDVDTARSRVVRTVNRLDTQDRPLPRTTAERLQRLLGLEDPDAAAPREAAAPGAGEAGDGTLPAVATLFDALADEGPLLLVADDLHWATPTMLAGLLEVLGRIRAGVMALGVGRPDMLEARLPGDDRLWFERLAETGPERPPAELVPVLPLEATAAERLLRAYLGAPADELDPTARDALLARAQGNPFFLAELLHLLVDRGVLRRQDDRWVLESEVPEDLLPAGVQAVLAARIDGLDGAAKGVLRDASVLGSRVTLDGLEAVGRASGHGDPAVVRQAVTTLVGRRLLEADADDGSYRFGHTLVRDVAYAGLAKAERARRHAAAAAHAAGSAGGRSAEADTAAASQGERAVALAIEMGLPPGDPSWTARGVAFPALARLGQAALGRDDNPAAMTLLGRALALTAPRYGEPLPDDLVLPVRVDCARALSSLHRLDEAERELEPALAAGEDAVRAGALLVLGEVRRKRGRHDAATATFVQALAAAGAAGIDRLTGEALRQLGLLDYFDGRLRSAEERFRQAHALAERVGDRRGAGWALQHLAWSATTRGDYELADRTLERAAEVFGALEDSGGLSWAAGTEGFVRLLQGRFTEARAVATSVLPLGEATGERWGVAAMLTIDAFAAAELGDIDAALRESAAARTAFSELGDAWGQALAAVAQGVAARGDDQPQRAVAVLAEAVRLSETVGHPVITGLALVVQGYASLDRGDLDGAEACAFRASALLAGLDLEPHAGLGAKVLLAQVLRARGHRDDALRELDAALDQTARPALLFPLRQAMAHRAGTLLELDRPREALTTARAAVDVPAEDVRSQVLALRALGAALRACGQPEEARLHVVRALEVARSTGQRSEIAATERLLEALEAQGPLAGGGATAPGGPGARGPAG
ncbi:MAG TPA: adenylate/guanylate cyclase domain-containing protein [Mycobacteriales bacterium]|nr:adenylate/guanylate cyclase domain-containing protein [Mycobacteriales bacterium]